MSTVLELQDRVKRHIDLTTESRKILKHFARFFQGRARGVKKEYIRVKIIRGLKRAFRQIANDKVPNRTLHSFNPSDKRADQAWRSLRECYFRNASVLEDIARTDQGPLTDGKSKRSHDTDGIAKSFNNSYCYDCFKSPEVRESLFFYVDLLFSDSNPDLLREKFDIECCNRNEHTIECEIKWISLKYFFNTLMLEELDLEPWFPSRLPSRISPLENNLSTQATQTES